MSKEGKNGNESLLWKNQTWVNCNSSRKNSQIELQGKESMVMANKKSKNGKRIDDSDGKEEKGSESDHEIHIWTERERRKKMRNMFSNLHSLLPQLPPKLFSASFEEQAIKADKSTIVDEAVNYIKTLEQTLEELQKQKLERLKVGTTFRYEPSSVAPQKRKDTREAFLADQGSSNNVGKSLVSSSHPVVFQTWTSSNVVLNIFGNEAQISICSSKKPGLFTAICYVLEKHNIEILSAHVSSDSHRCLYMIQAHVKGASDQFADANIQVEDIYRQAAGELICWVSS